MAHRVKQGHTGAEEDWMDVEPDLVDQPGLEQ